MILKLPQWLTKFIAFWVNFWYRIFGDKHPNALKVCEQLQTKSYNDIIVSFSNTVFCQSYSATLHKSRDDIIMGIPLYFFKRIDIVPSDGLVSVESAKFGKYKGNCDEESMSHSEIAGFSTHKHKRKRVYAFYAKLCDDLVTLGY